MWYSASGSVGHDRQLLGLLVLVQEDFQHFNSLLELERSPATGVTDRSLNQIKASLSHLLNLS